MSKIGVFLSILICAACMSNNQSSEIPIGTAQALWSNPAPTPAAFLGLETGLSDTGVVFRSCSHWHSGQIWEPGDFGNAVKETLLRTLQLEVDGERLNQRDIEIISTATLLNIFDTDGNLLGSQSGDISICFDLHDLEVGLHFASIQFESTSGQKRFEYMWAFEKTVYPDGSRIIEYAPN